MDDQTLHYLQPQPIRSISAPIEVVNGILYFDAITEDYGRELCGLQPNGWIDMVGRQHPQGDADNWTSRWKFMAWILTLSCSQWLLLLQCNRQ